MSDKKMMFLAVNMLITVLSVTQKIVEIIVIKETRKVSIVVLIIIVAAAGYFGYKMF